MLKRRKTRKEPTIAIIGLGYVGLALVAAFSKQYSIIAYDINEQRIRDLKNKKDVFHEISKKALSKKNITFTCNQDELSDASCYIIAVQTPINNFHLKEPVLTYTNAACETVGKYLKRNNAVIIESTVFPGYTEEVAQPILEKRSKLKAGKDFHLCYSPERINPGDKTHGLENVSKIVAGINVKALNYIDKIYSKIIKKPLHRAESIRVAEAAKLLENIQRDVNIALMNDVAKLFHKLKISTQDVIAAANSKWNFLPFKPGLVGGHCIGLDPYYLMHKAKEHEHAIPIVKESRKTNESMVNYIFEAMQQALEYANVKKPRIAVLGLAFKSNSSDLRNSKAVELVEKLSQISDNIICYDPCLDDVETPVPLVSNLKDIKQCHAVLINVAHQPFEKLTINDFKKLLCAPHLVFDLPGLLSNPQSQQKGLTLWQL
ncbi:MAG: nucleotide sugar dehydrogenase [Gammaproteobacteria bacterium]